MKASLSTGRVGLCVFDGKGGFWFTDLGKTYGRLMDRGAVYYARTDGSMIREAIYPILTPNGVGLVAIRCLFALTR